MSVESMKLELSHAKIAGDPKKEPLCVVRLTRSWWGDENGMHAKTSIRFLKRKCRYNFMAEEAIDIGYPEFVQAITNLDSVPQGIYKLVYDDVYQDWETGYYEHSGYKLVPYEEDDHVAERKG